MQRPPTHTSRLRPLRRPLEAAAWRPGSETCARTRPGARGGTHTQCVSHTHAAAGLTRGADASSWPRAAGVQSLLTRASDCRCNKGVPAQLARRGRSLQWPRFTEDFKEEPARGTRRPRDAPRSQLRCRRSGRCRRVAPLHLCLNSVMLLQYSVRTACPRWWPTLPRQRHSPRHLATRAQRFFEDPAKALAESWRTSGGAPAAGAGAPRAPAPAPATSAARTTSVWSMLDQAKVELDTAQRELLAARKERATKARAARPAHA